MENSKRIGEYRYLSVSLLYFGGERYHLVLRKEQCILVLMMCFTRFGFINMMMMMMTEYLTVHNVFHIQLSFSIP